MAHPLAWRHADGAVPNSIALGWVGVGGVVAIALLVAGNPGAAVGPAGVAAAWAALAAGTLLLAHVLIVAAYLLHEFAHHSIFRSAHTNARFGTAMAWVTGACWARFADLRHKHMRHHVDRADVIGFDTKAFLWQGPAWRRRLVVALEWAYLPAVEWLMHAHVMVRPFTRERHRAERARVVGIFVVRSAGFALLGLANVWALAGWAVAYTIMITVLRFTDAYQHTYDAFDLPGDDQPLPADKLRDAAYEQANTYSNLVSLGHPVLNWLLLNFPYHNAHHERPVEPWYRLPALHARLYPGEHVQTLPMRLCLRSFHRHRIRRVLDDDYGTVGTGPRRADSFHGAVAVSFLTNA